MNELNFLEQLKTRVKQTKNNRKRYDLIEKIYNFSNVKRYDIIKDINGEEYYHFSIESDELNITIEYFVSIVKGSFNDLEYRGLSILVNEIEPTNQDFPIEYATLFRLDGAIELYKFDYNKQNTKVPDNVKRLLKK